MKKLAYLLLVLTFALPSLLWGSDTKLRDLKHKYDRSGTETDFIPYVQAVLQAGDEEAAFNLLLNYFLSIKNPTQFTKAQTRSFGETFGFTLEARENRLHLIVEAPLFIEKTKQALLSKDPRILHWLGIVSPEITEAQIQELPYKGIPREINFMPKESDYQTIHMNKLLISPEEATFFECNAMMCFATSIKEKKEPFFKGAASAFYTFVGTDPRNEEPLIEMNALSLSQERVRVRDKLIQDLQGFMNTFTFLRSILSENELEQMLSEIDLYESALKEMGIKYVRNIDLIAEAANDVNLRDHEALLRWLSMRNLESGIIPSSTIAKPAAFLYRTLSRKLKRPLEGTLSRLVTCREVLNFPIPNDSIK